MFSRPKHVVIEVFGAADFGRIPGGYFICESMSGRRTFGNNTSCGLHWDVRRPASLSQAEVNRLPVVRLCFAQFRPGIARIGDVIAIDTFLLDAFEGDS